jgi:hypothetical protein
MSEWPGLLMISSRKIGAPEYAAQRHISAAL